MKLNKKSLMTKYKETAPHSEAEKLFKTYLDHVEKEEVLRWKELQPVSQENLLEYERLSDKRIPISKIAILKLNGGLGTTMGCDGPKSLIKIRGQKTFLDHMIESTHHPLILMNSYATDKQTKATLKKYPHVRTFLQDQYPRISEMSGEAYRDGENPKEEWNPPGHGDVYLSLAISGLLDDLINEGVEIVMLSNSDNLSATYDAKIHAFLEEKQYDFLMEVTKRTDQDKKGGAITFYNGIPHLLERASVPPEHINAFEDSAQFQFFNTNTLWIRLKSLKALIGSGKFQLPLIKNKKILKNGQTVIQLETAMGTIMPFFKKSAWLNVPRSRFFPVKTNDDLKRLKSQLC